MANAFYAPMAKATQYAAPDISKLLYEGIGNLPQDYYTGQQNAQQLALSRSLPQGLDPYWTTDPSSGKQVFDVYRYANDQARIGGPAQASPFVNALMGAQYAGQQAQRLGAIAGINQPAGGLPPGWAPPGQTQPAYSPPQTASPESNTLRKPSPAPASTPGPQSSAAPTGQPPEPTGEMDYLAGIATEHYGQGTSASKAIGVVARDMGVRPSDTLDAAQIKEARQRFADLNPDGTSAGARTDTDPASGPQPTFGHSDDVSNVPRATSAVERGVNGTPGPAPEAPVGGAGRGPVAPAGIPQRTVPIQSFTPDGRIRITPAGTPPVPPQAPPAQVAQAMPPQAGIPPQQAGAPPVQARPPGQTAAPASTGNPLLDVPLPGIPRELESLRRRALAATLEGFTAGYNPNKQMGEGTEKAANTLGSQLSTEYETRLKALYDANKLTPEAVDIYRGMGPAVAAHKGDVKQAEVAADAYGKQFDAAKEIAQKSATERPKLALAKRWLNDPSMYTGPWADKVMRAKQVLSALGGDPRAAMSQEAFNKAVQDLTLNIIQTLPPPVRVREMAIIQQAQAQSGITIPTNRLLVEMADRIYARGDDVYKIASEYGRARIGPEFEQREARYWAEHPLFSKAELADPRRIAPPITATPQDRVRMRIPDGEPSMTPDGRIITHGPQ